MGGIAVFILGKRLDPAGIPVPRLAVLGAIVATSSAGVVAKDVAAFVEARMGH
jgi:hypothetical protein